MSAKTPNPIPQQAYDRVAVEYGPTTQALYECLTSRVIGQEPAARALSDSHALYTSGLGRGGRGCADVFIFLGNTGVGKTTSAIEFAKFMIGAKDHTPWEPALTHISCETLVEQHSLANLFGAPVGYHGRNDGRLKQKTIERPHFREKYRAAAANFDPEVPRDISELKKERELDAASEAVGEKTSIVLLDDIEKAHPLVRNSLLGVFDNGFADVGDERTDLTRTFFIMTSNIGSQQIADIVGGRNKVIGFSNAATLEESRLERNAYIKQAVDRELKMLFPTEFIARFNRNIVVFLPLEREHIAKVLENELNAIQDWCSGVVAGQGPFLVCFSPQVKEFLIDKGVNSVFGLRHLHDVIRRYIKLPIANAIQALTITELDDLTFMMALPGQVASLGREVAARTPGAIPTLFKTRRHKLIRKP